MIFYSFPNNIKTFVNTVTIKLRTINCQWFVPVQKKILIVFLRFGVFKHYTILKINAVAHSNVI